MKLLMILALAQLGFGEEGTLTFDLSGDDLYVEHYDCSQVSPPAGTAPHILDTYRDYVGSPFGYSQSATNSDDLPRNKYIALEVLTPSEEVRRKETFEEPLANKTPAIYTVALSRCPGDFTNQGVEGVCTRTNLITNLNWSTRSNANPGIECALEPGQIYYLNIIHSQVAPYSQTSCSDFQCGVLFTEVPN